MYVCMCRDGSAVMQLKRLEPTVKGIIVRYDVNFTAEAGQSAVQYGQYLCG